MLDGSQIDSSGVDSAERSRIGRSGLDSTSGATSVYHSPPSVQAGLSLRLQRPCTLLRTAHTAISPRNLLRPGTPTAHERVALPLLPSGPGGVRRFPLRGAQPSTPPREAHSTRAALEKEFNPAEADCGLQGTANSPSSTAKPNSLAEGPGFEPGAQGSPVQGISSAAPSAARSPLLDSG